MKNNIDTYDLTDKQIQAAIDNYIYRRDYQKVRNQRKDVKEQRKEYNKKRNERIKKLIEQDNKKQN